MVRAGNRQLVVLIAAAVVVGVVSTGIVLRTAAVGGLRPLSDPAAGQSGRGRVDADERRQQLSGIRLQRARRGVLSEPMRATGVVNYDERRITDVNLKIEGWIRDLDVNFVGQRVKKGQSLFSVDSPDLVNAQTQLLAALRTRDQMSRANATEQPDYGDRLVESPRQRLVRWNVPEDQLRLIETQREILAAVVFRSPTDGLVIDKSVIRGMHVAPGETLFQLADISTVWIDAEFPESDVSRLRLGVNATIVVDAWPNERFEGRVVSVHPFLSVQKTVKVRIETSNSAERLKPGMLASVELAAPPHEGVLIPVDAVVDTGNRQVVFVSEGNGRFRPRDVELGYRGRDQVVVRSGVQPNEEIVTRAAFLMDAESQLQSALNTFVERPDTKGAQTIVARPDLKIVASPNSLRVGKNAVEVTVEDSSGKPVTDLEMRIAYVMPPMPSMNMPEMRAESRLEHAGRGVYRGTALISMQGQWNLTVTALRNTHVVATMQSRTAAQ